MGGTVLCLQLYIIANTTVNVCRHSYDFLFCWPLIKSAYGKTSNIIIYFLYAVMLLFFLYILSTVYVQKGEKYNQRLLSSGPLYDMVSCKFLDKSCILHVYCSNTVLFPSTFLLVDNTKMTIMFIAGFYFHITDWCFVVCQQHWKRTFHWSCRQRGGWWNRCCSIWMGCKILKNIYKVDWF